MSAIMNHVAILGSAYLLMSMAASVVSAQKSSRATSASFGRGFVSMEVILYIYYTSKVTQTRPMSAAVCDELDTIALGWE